MEGEEAEIKLKLFKKYESSIPVIFEIADNHVYYGTYLKTALGGRSIRVRDFSEFPEEHRIAHSQFYRVEMLFFHAFEEIERFKTNPHYQGMSYDEYLNAKDLVMNHKYIPVYDCHFQEIMQEIRAFNAIGIFAIGAHAHRVRYARISTFVVATRKQVYLFDIQLTPKSFWDMGIKNLLEDKNIKKVVFDSQIVADLLLVRYKIQIENVFDVMVADVEICQNHTRQPMVGFKAFPELAQRYLSMPKGIFNYMELVVTGVTHTMRPLSDKAKRDFALIPAFLLPLYDIQRSTLLQNFYFTSENYFHVLYRRTPPCRDSKFKEMEEGLAKELQEVILQPTTNERAS